MENQFSFGEQSQFDFKLFLLKLLKNWKLFIIALLITFFIAHYLNVRKQNIYALDTYVTVKDENNPFFTSNMSLVFNWGGVSDKVDMIVTTFKSRTHNEDVIRALKSYIVYSKKGKYHLIDIYKDSPFELILDEDHAQLINVPMKIKFLDENTFELSFEVEQKEVQVYDYKTLKLTDYKLENRKFKQNFKIGEVFNLNFLSGKIVLKPIEHTIRKGKDYVFELKNFNQVVMAYKDQLKVKTKDKNSSILVMTLRGTNKQKLQDYLNVTTQMLQDKILDDKNKYAINTIKFIDSTMSFIQNDLTSASKDLKKFVKNKTVLNLDDPTAKIYEKITALDLKKNTIFQKKIYYEQLQRYLNDKRHYADLPAPTVVGIEDPTIIQNVAKITQLAIERKKMASNFQQNSIPIQKIDLEIESIRKSLLETTGSVMRNLGEQMKRVRGSIYKLEARINKLPEEKQTLLTLKRKYDLKEEIYNTLLQKRNEASIVKASNVSDLKIIDSAKDIGQLPVAPNRKINYLLALLLGLLLPALYTLTVFVFDNKIHDVSDLEDITDIPLLGYIHHFEKKGKLPVLNFPSGVVTESFRSLRSSLRFMFNNPKASSKSILVTSSISKEGKTFISTNLGLIQAISDKKTVVLEFDLRKPKFKEYFEEAKIKQRGIVHFLTGEATLDDIIVSTSTKKLDIILAGSVPPNPSELILNRYTEQLFKELSERYDYIVIDTPPIGLVSDAMELQKYADFLLFVTREEYTLRSFVKKLDERYKKKEIKNVAIIYNDFKVNMMKRYGYSKNYGYGYGYGYGGYFDQKRGFFGQLKHKIKKYLKGK